MQEHDFIAMFAEPLERARIDYMVTGSVAAMFYGQPRMTHDIDMVVNIGASQIEMIRLAYPETTFYCPPIETIQQEISRETRGHFNIISLETSAKADIYPVGNDPLHRWAMKRVQTVELEGQAVRIAPPEYVILRKLEYFREGHSEKHLRDIQEMLGMSANQIDKTWLDTHISQRGLCEIWTHMQKNT